MPRARVATPDDRLLVNEVLRRAVEAASWHGIAIGRREGGKVSELVIAGTTDAVRNILAVRNDPVQLTKAGPWDMLAKRASELVDFPQLVPFVHRELIKEGRLHEPAVIGIRAVSVDLPFGRKASGLGPFGSDATATARKQSALVAVTLEEGPLAKGTGWAAIEHHHVTKPDPSDYERQMVERPLNQVLRGLNAAHPTTPVIVNRLEWPHQEDGLLTLRLRYPDIELQLDLHRGGQLIFQSQEPMSDLHFEDIDGPSHLPFLDFRGKDIGMHRTIQMTDSFGRTYYHTTSTAVPREKAASAIARLVAQQDEIANFVRRFRECGVLAGNAQGGIASAVRAACVEITDLFLEARVTRFAE